MLHGQTYITEQGEGVRIDCVLRDPLDTEDWVFFWYTSGPHRGRRFGRRLSNTIEWKAS